ncbi:hypothetical protein HSBAA_PA_0190 (plasmid) [Vreelandella sulfidaeris]|uniref:HTH cro/C1-type domain-containing protein n=1 Tax=Vreelandella sulfidaeris TaxID=115553 RepID=A0A455UGL4_9GAMM|nr:hypothetical protein HSBAA_PA_0190 [Halomonas sulfidaeris]
MVQVIFERAVGEGLASTDLADHLGIAPSTLSHLKTGRRLASSLGRDVIEKFAEFLNYPVLAVLILAEQVHLSDFTRPEMIWIVPLIGHSSLWLTIQSGRDDAQGP